MRKKAKWIPLVVCIVVFLMRGMGWIGEALFQIVAQVSVGIFAALFLLEGFQASRSRRQRQAKMKDLTREAALEELETEEKQENFSH